LSALEVSENPSGVGDLHASCVVVPTKKNEIKWNERRACAAAFISFQFYHIVRSLNKAVVPAVSSTDSKLGRIQA